MPVKNPTKTQKMRWNLWSRYKMTLTAFGEMLIRQNGRCAICENPLGTDLRIDHNHQSGKVRGLLCHECNIKLPVVEECGWMMLAWAYLDETE